MNELRNKKCIPCESGMPPMEKNEILQYIPQIDANWKVLKDKKLERKFTFKNFKESMRFVNRVAGIAETEGHHPDISISWNHVVLSLTTHAIGGLSENDFILAAKIDIVES